MSAVAGSSHRIADVVVASRWKLLGHAGSTAVNPALLALVHRGAAALPAPLESCTRVPPTSSDGTLVCLGFEPDVFFVPLGHTSDPFGGKPFQCVPGDNEVVGCVLPQATAEVEDMETGAVARVAARHGVPFVAMRATSDGAGDPLGDRGFPTQFFDYYRLAAKNASLVTRAALADLHRLADDPASRPICKLLAKRRWRRAAARLKETS